MNQILPNFSSIKFLPAGSTAKNAEQPNLFKLFHASVHNQPLEIDEHLFRQFIQNDLDIDVATADNRLVCVLQDALVYYMSVWPGWGRGEEYYKGNLDENTWYEKFRQYLILKTNFVIKETEKLVSEMDENTKNVAVQTNETTSSVCPYAVCISGPPNMLNSLVFCEDDGDIVVQALDKKPLSDVIMVDMLNWPFVSVEVKLPNLSFTRTMTHKYERYLAHGRRITISPIENAIVFIKRTEEAKDKPLKPYAHKFIASFVENFLLILKKVSLIENYRTAELSIVCNQFLKDIEEANINNGSMCSGISVGYHIGKFKYIRKKHKVVGKTNHPVSFYEIITPQVEFTLNQFEESQLIFPNGAITFTSLYKLFHGEAEMNDLTFFVNNTCMVYNCTFCSQNFSGPHAYHSMLKHFKEVHEGEHPVKCCNCLQEFSFVKLARQRWRHSCASASKSVLTVN